jgi:sphinganine-1-phosphate aldolase
VGETFPNSGCTFAEVQRRVEELASRDLDPTRQRMWVLMHQGDDDVHRVAKWAYERYFHFNAFTAEYEQGQAQMQEEVLDWTVSLLNGGSDAAANFTSGGSESIFCGVHAAREWAKSLGSRFQEPYEVVVPWTIHPAFDKAAHYLGVKSIRVPVAGNYRADPEAMEAAITPHTIAMACSAPCWGLGFVDPVPEIAGIAERLDLWMHVDACLGGFLLPFMERLEISLPTFDFRVPGVCSISADLHKHGYVPKPASTISYRTKHLQSHHWVNVDDWHAGMYSTQGFVGSRPFSSVAAAWSVMTFLGIEGYVDLTRRCLEMKERLTAGIEAIGDFVVLRNDCLLTPFRSETLDMRKVMAGIVLKGYFPFGTTNPVYLHPGAEAYSDDVLDAFLTDLADIRQGILSGRITEEAAATYGAGGHRVQPGANEGSLSTEEK